MVNNKMKILDEGEIKICPEIIMVKKWYETDSLYFIFATSDKQYTKKQIRDDDLNDTFIDVENEHYIEPSRKFIAWRKKCFKESILGGLIPNDDYRFCENPYKECVKKFWTHQEILDYLKIIPFTPSVMINISPDWGDKGRGKRIEILKQIIDNYMKEGWYEKWDYVIECGSQGDHIHAHIVAKMNTKRLKSVETHLRKGRHTPQLIKYAKHIRGMEGIIKGNGVQKTFLRTEELEKDKLDYLIEDLKPQGHKNHHIIKDGYVSGCL